LFSEYCIIFVLEIKTRTQEKTKTLLPMKNAKNMLVVAMMALTTAAYANVNNATYTTEEKVKVAVLNNALPAAAPVLDSPAPQKVKNTIDTNNHSATQKAAIVGLQLKSVTTK
jgi:hypothetical protein